MPRTRVLCFVCWRGQESEGNRSSCSCGWDCFNAHTTKVTLTVCTLQEFLTALSFSTFPCSLALLLNAYMVFILIKVWKYTDFFRNFQQIEAFRVMDSGVLIFAVKIFHFCLSSDHPWIQNCFVMHLNFAVYLLFKLPVRML